MTVLTIRAQDTATAMDEIVEKLGKDSFIIGTKKIGNKILVKATNKPKKEISLSGTPLEPDSVSPVKRLELVILSGPTRQRAFVI